MNDKYHEYFNDEGEFLIPFEAIQRGKRPRRIQSAWGMFVLYSAVAIGVVCGLGWVLLHVAH